MTALLVLSQYADSHPFEERRVSLQDRERVHVGRCNGMNQPSPGNTIFDCKVLSRNHALLWYEGGKFWLQDTKSSNGTFVNSNRVGKVSIVSEPHELHSGDLIQFGVSVTENAKKTTHECIISEARLFHPDGQEALQNTTTIKRDASSSDAVRLYELTECLQEACHREELIERKVTLLQQTLADIYASAEEGWKAMINEDRLLAKIDALEAQLSVLYKDEAGAPHGDEEAAKRRLAEAYEELSRTEEASRAMYTKILDEKLGAMRRINELEPRLEALQEEAARLRAANEASRADASELLGRQQEALHQAQLRCDRWEQQCALSVGEAQSLQQKMDDVERENHSLRARLLQLGKDAAGGHGPDRETAIICDDLPNGEAEVGTAAADHGAATSDLEEPTIVGGEEATERADGDGETGRGAAVGAERRGSEEMAALRAAVAEREAELAGLRAEAAERRSLEYSLLAQECDRLRLRVRHIEEEMAAARRENARLHDQLRCHGAGGPPRPLMNGDLSPDGLAKLQNSETLLRRAQSAEVEELKGCLSEVCRGYDHVVVQNKWSAYVAPLSVAALVAGLSLLVWARRRRS